MGWCRSSASIACSLYLVITWRERLFFWARLVKGQMIQARDVKEEESYMYSLMCGLFIDSLSLIVNSLFSAVCT